MSYFKDGDIVNFRKLVFQIIKFGFVGLIASIIDVGLLTFFSEVLNVDVIVSSAISFSASAVVNYLLSMRFVFNGKAQNKVKEFVIFVSLSIGGLCINQVIMWVGVTAISMHYLMVKVFAMILVPAYNFITRKIFLE